MWRLFCGLVRLGLTCLLSLGVFPSNTPVLDLVIIAFWGQITDLSIPDWGGFHWHVWQHARGLIQALLQTVSAWLILGIAGIALILIGWRRPWRRPTSPPTAGENLTTITPARSVEPIGRAAAALRSFRWAFLSIALFSGVSNVLMLTGAIFMLEIYDRVLPSRSIPTLLGLAALAVILYVILGALDLIRSCILVRIGSALDEQLSGPISAAMVRLPLIAGARGDDGQPMRDLDSVRAFLAGRGPVTLFDLPWLPLYLFFIFALHSWLGWTALAGAVILLLLTLLTEAKTRGPMLAVSRLASQRADLAEAMRRNAMTVAAMGMERALELKWKTINNGYVAENQRISNIASGLGALSRVLRLLLQSAVLGLGAYLVIRQEATAGSIVAGSILTARALAPVDLAIGHWRNFTSARQSWRRLVNVLELFPTRTHHVRLPAPCANLAAVAVTVAAPGQQRVLVHNISFTLEAGQGLAVIGPSGSGKSTLARAMVRAWLPIRGRVRLDGADLQQWSPEELGRHLGYLPQEVELFGGTVAENIARFEPNCPSEAVIAAAKAARVHDMIVGMRDGYEAEIGEHGALLSAGQRQRIALARALYRDPFLVVLDEPNSNLDADGETALTEAILAVRRRGGIVVIVAHRPSALAGIDHILVLNQGRQQAFGPKEEVLAKMFPKLQTVAVRRHGIGSLTSDTDKVNR